MPPDITSVTQGRQHGSSDIHSGGALAFLSLSCFCHATTFPYLAPNHVMKSQLVSTTSTVIGSGVTSHGKLNQIGGGGGGGGGGEYVNIRTFAVK